MTGSGPGWYPDGQDARISRFWNGSQWAGERFWNGVAWIDPAPPANPLPVSALTYPAAASSATYAPAPPTVTYPAPGQWAPAPPAHMGGPLPALSGRIVATGALRSRLLLILAGAAVVIIGSLLPWATQNDGITTTTIDGSSAGGGQVLIVIGLALAVLVGLYLAGIIGKRTNVAVLILGVLAIAICIANMSNISHVMGQEKTESADLVQSGGGTKYGVGLIVVLVGCVLVIVGSVMVWRAARARRPAQP
jgi:Protein of unknown function (DUF2510)